MKKFLHALTVTLMLLNAPFTVGGGVTALAICMVYVLKTSEQ